MADWFAQPALNRIQRGSVVVRVRPKLMDILAFLAARHGEVVPQDLIIESVWTKRFMAETALTRCIAELRDILGDDAASPRYIQTITKRGYRLIAPVEWVAGPPAHRRSAPDLETHPDGGPGGNGAHADAHPPRSASGAPCGVRWGERDIPLAEGANIIGRDAGAVVRVSSAKVSRQHASIVVLGGRAVLEDLGSKNGTYLSGRRVKAPTELSDGDEILVGRDVLIFRFCYPIGPTLTDNPG